MSFADGFCNYRRTGTKTKREGAGQQKGAEDGEEKLTCGHEESASSLSEHVAGLKDRSLEGSGPTRKHAYEVLWSRDQSLGFLGVHSNDTP